MSQAKLWVVSDTHFFHENMYKFTTFGGTERVRHQFQSAEEGDAAMVERWNSVVDPTDHIYHLGDVSMDRSSAQVGRFVALIQSLNGHKRLILGNHDHFPVKVYVEAGFQKVKGSHRIDRWAVLTHIPIHPLCLGEGLINVHGHIHERPAFGPQYRNVSVEQIAYTPVLLESLR